CRDWRAAARSGSSNCRSPARPAAQGLAARWEPARPGRLARKRGCRRSRTGFPTGPQSSGKALGGTWRAPLALISIRDWLPGSLAAFEFEVRDRHHHGRLRDLNHAWNLLRWALGGRTVLKSIDPILTPDLLWPLASMGHGDDLVFVDANHPATRIVQSSTSQLIILF